MKFKVKYLPPLIWIAAGAMMCVFLARVGDVGRLVLSQIFLFYGAIEIAIAGAVVHTIDNRHENLSSVNYGYKLLAEILAALVFAVFMLKDIFF